MRGAAAALLLIGFASCVSAQQSSSPAYAIRGATDGAITIERSGKRAIYRPVFVVIRAESDPQLGLSAFASTPGESLHGVNVENYPLPRWRAASGSGTTDVVYQAGSVTEVRATGSRALPDGSVTWTFAPAEHFTLEAEVRPDCERAATHLMEVHRAHAGLVHGRLHRRACE